ncbi:MAG: DUF2341 domain-containing protein [Candidatus Aenigmatarchaeota archaeon]
MKVLMLLVTLTLILFFFIKSYASPESYPQYCCNSTNSTVAGKPTLFSLKWLDDSGLSGFVFQFCNGTWNGSHCLSFDPNFLYRKALVIDNTANSNGLTDYQVRIVLDTQALISQGKMQSDCEDIRFKDDDKFLSYWLESGCNTSQTIIWVKVPSIPASSKKTIYLYYGNSEMSSASNPEETFDFFEDFAGTSLNLSKWNVTEYSTQNCNKYYEVRDGKLHVYSWSQDPVLDQSCPGPCGYTFTTSDIETSNFIVEVLANYSNLDYCRGFGSVIAPILVDNQSHYWGIGINLQGDNYVAINWWEDGASGSSNPSDYTNAIENFTYTKLGESVTLMMIGNYFATRNPVGIFELPFKLQLVSNAGACWWSCDGIISYDAYWDFVRIRKYSYPEPTISFGEEESAWIIDSWVPFTSDVCSNPYKECWSNVTKVINSTVGAKIAFRFHANNSNNYWNSSLIYSFTTFPEVYCGNRKCDSGETCFNCLDDCSCPGSPGCCGSRCGCPEGYVCVNNNCVKPSQPSPIPSPPTCSQDFITLSEEKNATLVVKCMDKNQTRNFTFSNFLLYNLTLKANVSTYNFIIRIQRLSESLIDQSIRLDKKVYYYLEFSRENLNEKNLAKIIARFRVEKSWVYSENINASTISLYRLTTSWEKLPTYKIDEDSSFLYFESELPGFSLFTIGGEEKVVLPLPQCPICPGASEWSECKEGRRNRTLYTCSEETNFTCLQYTEEQECEEEKKEEEGLSLLYIGLALLAFVPIVLLILYLRKLFKPKKEIKLEKEVICPRCFLKMEKTYSGRNIEMYECKKCGYVRPEIKESYFEEET